MKAAYKVVLPLIGQKPKTKQQPKTAYFMDYFTLLSELKWNKSKTRCQKESIYKTSEVIHTPLIPVLGNRGRWIEFESNLVYWASSRIGPGTGAVTKKQKEKKKQESLRGVY